LIHNAADIVIIVLLALGFLNGLRQGFVVEVATIFGAVVALAIAKAEYSPVRHLLATVAPRSPWLTVISYLAVFLVVWAVIVAVARKIRLLVRLLFLGWLDRLGGAIVGVLQAALLIELLLYLGKRVPNRGLHRFIAHSSLAPNFLHVIPTINRLFPHVPHA
jgi:membrane protein required for colicin V production